MFYTFSRLFQETNPDFQTSYFESDYIIKSF
nr:MAG TPA: hypothetical protein [Caudoviricetes sp.]